MADLLRRNKKQLDKYSFIEYRIYSVPESEDFPDGVKYSMNFVIKEECVLRYDNERGKGHHRHLGEVESKIQFKSINILIKNFFGEVGKIRRGLK
ncbi:MAG: DUF6516 family protein [Candidatus Diapherotrites archaeon]